MLKFYAEISKVEHLARDDGTGAWALGINVSRCIEEEAEEKALEKVYISVSYLASLLSLFLVILFVYAQLEMILKSPATEH